MTTRGADGNWEELTNLGAQANSDQHDRCPAFSPNFQTFFFDLSDLEDLETRIFGSTLVR